MTTFKEITMAELHKEQRALIKEQSALMIDLQITQIELQRDLMQLDFDQELHTNPYDAPRQKANATRLEKMRKMNTALSDLRFKRIEVKHL